MTKNEVTKFVQANGGRTRYDGRKKIMYIYDFRGVGIMSKLYGTINNFQIQSEESGGRYANNVG